MTIPLYFFLENTCQQCFVFFSFLPPQHQSCLMALMVLNHYQPAVSQLTSSTPERASWTVRKFPDFLFPIWHQGLSIVEVTPTVPHKHSLADYLPSQCRQWHFPSLSGGLIFMYFHCNYMAVFLDFQNALVFPHWSFSSTAADQVELLPTLS